MTIPLWVSVIVAVIAGIFGGIVGPLINDFLLGVRWKKQKSFELKYEAFQGAVNALAAWEADALDFALQRDKAEYKGSSRATEIRPSTSQALEHYKGLVAGLFSNDVASTYDQVLHSPIAIDNVPNTDFEERRSAFIVAAAAELGLLKKKNDS
ncbi:MAG: hypothetical protein V7731_13430 [Amphritea sp.]